MKNDKDEHKPRAECIEGRTDEDGGLVEQLIRRAGPGPEPPKGGSDRVKEAIRPSWHQEVTEQSRQRRLLWTAALAAAAAVVIAAIYLPMLRQGPADENAPAISIALIDGTLEVSTPDAPPEVLDGADLGAELAWRSVVRTKAGSRAALKLADGGSLRLDHSTEIQLETASTINLVEGAVYLDSMTDARPGLEVRTELGTAREVGTQFEVRFQHQTLDVRVREGAVSLLRGGDEYEIAQGIAVTVAADGTMSSLSIAPYDPAWEWAQAVAPPFEIEDRSVLAFLDWVSSETGLSVRFADSEVEKLVETTILHGSIEAIPPAQAPAAVLPTCNMTVTEEPGTLVVGRLETD